MCGPCDIRAARRDQPALAKRGHFGSGPRKPRVLRRRGAQPERNVHRSGRLGAPELLGEYKLSASSRSRIGLRCIAGAIRLYCLSFFFRYVGYFLPPSGPAGQDSFYLGLHVVWLPLIGTVLIGAIAAVFVIGVWFVWGDPARFVAIQRAYLGLASLALAAAFGAA